ncbi:hypothetical protein ACIPQH_25230 [Streptomyces rubiginosohelvolus]|uniref:hypothetical protein n=1 Tax=Streptomyces rubiginosohelvolus TaxID=67362 RepID=UPI003825F382
MAEIEIPDTLIDLERAAWTEQEKGQLTVETAAAVQQAITKHAAATPGLSRYELEKELKRRVRLAEAAAD